MFNSRVLHPFYASSLILAFAAPAAQGKQAADGTLCLLAVDIASGKTLYEKGSCSNRHTPASTFKIPLAVMGYDSGFLKSAKAPVLAYRQGEPDWGGKNWKAPVDPTAWMQYSVVWYSQRIAFALGIEKLRHYATLFEYGNADFSGDKGHDNGLERAWIASSLQVSPREQTEFLRKMLLNQLPVSATAQQQAASIVQEGGHENGWHFYGKTGMAYPRNADYSFNYANPYGWYVGWASKGKRKIVYAVLRQDPYKMEDFASVRAKQTLQKFLQKFP